MKRLVEGLVGRLALTCAEILCVPSFHQHGQVSAGVYPPANSGVFIPVSLAVSRVYFSELVRLYLRTREPEEGAKTKNKIGF